MSNKVVPSWKLFVVLEFLQKIWSMTQFNFAAKISIFVFGFYMGLENDGWRNFPLSHLFSIKKRE
jgi:hypothetical protein